MTILTKKDAKTAASALRRELANLNKPSSEISHNETLMLLARALGARNWNTLEASLPREVAGEADGLHLLIEELLETRQTDTVATQRARLMLDHWYKTQQMTPAPEPSMYPLVNDGLFDFEEAGENAIPVTGAFEQLEGTYERLTGTAAVSSARREGSTLELDFMGETFVNWNDQTTVRRRGVRLWLDEDQNSYSESQLVLAPSGWERDLYSAPLTVRQALVDAYLAYLAENAKAWPSTEEAQRQLLSNVAKTLGFALTRNEEDVVLSHFKN